MNSVEVAVRPRRWFQSKVFYLVLLTTAVAGAALVLIARNGVAKTTETASKEQASVALEFAASDIVQVRLQTLARTVSLSGSLAPLTEATVKSTVAGEVQKLMVREGESVRQGMVLAEIDVTDARTRLEAALADQAERRARLEIATRNRDTNLGLLKQNFISQNAFDQLQSTLQASQAAVQWADAQIKLVRQSINDAVVRAPMTGQVAKRLVNGGERVAPDSPLLHLVDLSRLELEASLPAGDVAQVAAGQAVHFLVDGFGTRQFEGRVERINPVAEVGSRAIKLFVSVPNPQGLLRGGMFAQGRVTVAQSQAMPVIPATALFEEAGQSYVFAVKAGQLVKQAVSLGLRDEATGLVEVRQGLEAGVQVVRLRMTGLKAGQAVVLRAAESVKPGQTPA